MPSAGVEPQPDLSVEELVEQVRPYVRQDKLTELTEVLVTYSRQHIGPLPAPETFAEYDRALPGTAERIVAMAEGEQTHRHKIERDIVWHEYVGRYAGQAGAFLALAMLLTAVCFCAYIGQPLAAGVIAAVGAVVIGFLRYSAKNSESSSPAPVAPPPVPPKRRKR